MSNRFKSSNSAKMNNVCQNIVQTLDDETLRLIFDSRCEDLKIKGNQRFWSVLNRTCVNRKINLREMNIGIKTAKILATILTSDVDLVAHLDLAKNLIADKGVEILAPAF